MKNVRLIWGVFIIFFLCAASGSAVEFRLKMSAGLGFLSPDEVNGNIKSWEGWQIRNIEDTPSWNFLGGEVSGLDLGYNFEIEFLISLSSRFAAGIASGYIFSTVSEEATTLSVEKVLGTYEIAKPTKMSGIPLILSVYYFQPITSSLRLYARGGAGLLWATYVEREANRKKDTKTYSYPLMLQASARDKVYILALGLLFETEPGIQFFLEGSWRSAKISGFTGKDQSGGEGTLFFCEEYASSLDFWQGKYKIFPEKPTGENFRRVKEATIDFSGVAIKLGIMIRF